MFHKHGVDFINIFEINFLLKMPRQPDSISSAYISTRRSDTHMVIHNELMTLFIYFN